MMPIGLGIVGCGYVADFYAVSIASRVPEIRLAGAADLDQERVRSFSDTYGGRGYDSVSDLLADAAVDVVLNLTPPQAHPEISLAALRAGKHVYSEKPMTSSFQAGQEIVDLARQRQLAFGCAPSISGSRIGKAFESLLASKALGTISHLYCDVDDGPLHRMNPESWRNSRGISWPYKSEFADGPVVHHLPYAVTWAVVLAGRAITAAGITNPAAVPEKLGVRAGPDLCTLIIEHASGCTSRLTVGALAPRNRSLMLIGTDHVAEVPDIWATDGPLLLDDEQILGPADSWPFDTTHRLDFASGIQELVRHIGSPEDAVAYTEYWGGLALHVLEICTAFHRPGSRLLHLPSPTGGHGRVKPRAVREK